MDLPLSRRVASDLVVLESSPSTNSNLLAWVAAGPVADYTTVVTFDQTAGRGRLGRTWTSLPGSGAAISVLSPAVELASTEMGWLPLIAGLAMTRAVATEVDPARVGVKWPNDVLVDDLKVCGVLAEVAPSGRVVIGAGLNLAMTREQLPVPTATSLVIAGVAERPDLADRVIAAYLTAFRSLFDDLTAGGAEAARVRDDVRAACRTLGREVRVELPGGEPLTGRGIGIDDRGRLLVEAPGAEPVAVSAGEVVHLRTV